MLVFWRDKMGRDASPCQFLQSLDLFAKSFSRLIPPEIPTFPCLSNLKFESSIELVSFFMPFHKLDKTLFERAYQCFHNTFILSVVPAGILTASKSNLGGRQGQSISLQDQEVVRFTGVLSWKSKEARKEWYQAFARGMKTSYERLGHKIDYLKIVASTGVESRSIELEPEDTDIVRVENTFVLNNLGVYV
ncbi:hypothetical protein F5884DRAFT_774541 [Xylogone sp. PMI_703]|nr:hypothetical protein F5884DRAFT_774541 [Xylogone sp. PMI_703]